MRAKIIIPALFGALSAAGLAAFYLQQPGMMGVLTALYGPSRIEGIWEVVEVHKDGRVDTDKAGSFLSIRGSGLMFVTSRPPSDFDKYS